MKAIARRMIAETPAALLQELRAVGLDVRARPGDRLAAAHDASHYQLTPLAVVAPKTIADVSSALAVSGRHRVSVTFRSAGTSLSGQAGASGVVLDTQRNFREIEVLDDGKRVRCGPGATVRAVNLRLARYGRKLGPDPASEIACTIGGVVANNSSGMACGIEQNTYRTLDSSVLVLASGTVVDTSLAEADERLGSTEPTLYEGLVALRDLVRSDRRMRDRIAALYSIKNTMGYGVNSLVDYERPVDILEHLVIGSEGTLAFIAEATFRTVRIKPHAATGLLIFPDLATATGSLPDLVAAGFATIELLDATSLRVAQGDPQATTQLRCLDIVSHAALLVELQESSRAALVGRRKTVKRLLDALPLAHPASLDVDPTARAQLWHIRKGLFTAVAGARPPGTTALLEDVAVPVSRLLETCTRLTELLDFHGYEGSVIFGHAKDGNIHFMINERFDDPDSLIRYRAFTQEMVSLILDQGGTLKAEHGTGRIMAPFLPRQVGDDLYQVMRRIKRLFDPAGLLNPGVLLTDDADSHLSNLKSSPSVEEEVDRCVECGYCEPVCPSKDLTLTPRERIVLRREIQRARDQGDTVLVAELEEQYRYEGVQTCAADGMCEVACPVLINTGDLVRRLRGEAVGAVPELAWTVAAKNWASVSSAAGAGLTFADRVPAALPIAATAVARAILGHDAVPAYSAELPEGGKRRVRMADPEPVAVYFSSCTTTMFGPAGDGLGVPEAFLALCHRAGVPIATPTDLPQLCCGTPWKSKGLQSGYSEMAQRVVASLIEATKGGRIPVVCDASSCTEGLRVMLDAASINRLRVIDAVAFVDDHVLPTLPPAERVKRVVLHPTCSSSRLGINDAFVRVAGAAAAQVTVPDEWSCCGFAGDRGMLHPELTAAATEREAREVIDLGPAAHASMNRTCELGMTRATGQPYQHVLELLELATRQSS